MEGLLDVLDCIKVNDAIHYKKLQLFSVRGNENSVV